MTREEELIQVKTIVKKKLKDAPSGTLIVKKNKKCSKYYRRSASSKQETYLGKKDESLIKGLQEKLYYTELLKATENELKALTKIKRIQEKIVTFENIFLNTPENKRTLIRPFNSCKEEELKLKIERECKLLKGTLNDRKGIEKSIQLTTLNGERVRSKSELIIADRLKIAGIPYVYEAKQLLVDEEAGDYEVWFPDFQTFNAKTGEKYYWEHFGMMDNPDYCASSQFKLETYAKYGIIQGKNLIVTTESSKHSLNTDYIDCLINQFLK